MILWRGICVFMIIPIHRRLSSPIAWEYPRIPDRRAGIMKYQSGNARRAPTRGAFAFEFPPDRISLPLFPGALLERCSFVPEVVGVLEMNFPVALETPMAYFFRQRTLPPLPRSRLEKKRNLMTLQLNAYVRNGRPKGRKRFFSGGTFISRRPPRKKNNCSDKCKLNVARTIIPS